MEEKWILDVYKILLYLAEEKKIKDQYHSFGYIYLIL